MRLSWSPHARYRLYAGWPSYWLPVRGTLLTAAEGACKRLETEICRRMGVAAAACVPMARTGLYLAISELIRPGQSVVMSPLTIADVVNMVLLAGGIPVFSDIRRESCALDPDQAESLINANTGAVLITHLHGESAGAHVFAEICRRRGVPLIEDVSQAFGASEDGRRLGAIGDVGVYSFGFFKNVNAWQGGMVVAQDARLIDRVRRRMERWPVLRHRRLLAACVAGLLTDLGTCPPLFASVVHPVIRYSFLHDIEAVNRRLDPERGACRLGSLPPDYRGRMNETQAKIALHGLARVDADNAARIGRARRYHEGMQSLDRLTLPRWREDTSHIYTYYPVQLRERHALLRRAMSARRDFAAQHLRNCADLPDFSQFSRNCPNARRAAAELILLPTYPRYPKAEVERNIHIIHAFLGGIE